MEELLFVSFDNNERKDECGLCVFKRHKNGKIEVLKMEFDEQAKILYKLLTDQSTKADIKSNRLEREVGESE